MKNTSSYAYWQSNAKQFADFYGRGTALFSPQVFVKKFLSQRTDTLLSYCQVTNKTVLLDVGCGSGEHMKDFIPRAKHVYGIDYSKQMIDIAKTELKQFPSKKYTLLQGDAAKIPLPSKSVDVIIAMGLLDYVDSPEVVIAECRRLLKPNGIFVFSMPKSPSLFSFLRTPLGIVIRKLLFQLPPIKNAMTHDEMKRALKEKKFVLEHSTPIWDAMWMVKSTKV